MDEWSTVYIFHECLGVQYVRVLGVGRYGRRIPRAVELVYLRAAGIVLVAYPMEGFERILTAMISWDWLTLGAISGLGGRLGDSSVHRAYGDDDDGGDKSIDRASSVFFFLSFFTGHCRTFG